MEMKKDDTHTIRYEKSLFDLKRYPNKSFVNEAYERKDVRML